MRIAGAAIVASAALLVAACGGSGEDPYVEVIGTRWATAEAESVPALVASSDAVFVGRVTQELPQRTETLPGPANRPVESRTFPISRYETVVESSVAGGVGQGSTVVVEQAGGEAPGDGHTVMLEGDELIEAGKTYVFFATRKENGTWTAAPYGRLEVLGDGSLSAAEEWRGLPASQALDGSGVTGASGEIRSAAGE
jgi:hypothetical protein